MQLVCLVVLTISSSALGVYDKAAVTETVKARFEDVENNIWPTKNWKNLTEFYADDAVFSMAGKLAKGKEEILKLFSSSDIFNQWALSPQSNIREMDVHKHIVTFYADFSYPNQDNRINNVPFLQVWKKYAGDQWLIKYDWGSDSFKE